MFFGLWRKASQAVFQPRLGERWQDYVYECCLGDLMLWVVTFVMTMILIHCARTLFLMGAYGVPLSDPLW